MPTRWSPSATPSGTASSRATSSASCARAPPSPWTPSTRCTEGWRVWPKPSNDTGWSDEVLRSEDRYRIEQLIRAYLYQEDRIIAALRRLDTNFYDLRQSSEDAAKRIADFLDSLQQAAEQRRNESPLARMLPPYTRNSVIDFADPEIAHVPSMDGKGFSRSVPRGRLKDNGYGADRIPDQALRDLIDLVLAVQAEYQLQSLLLDREFQRIVDTRSEEVEYLKAAAAEAAAEAASSSFLGILGDVLGIVSAVAGVLAMVPVLTPLAGPIALATAAGALAAHTADAVIQGDWDAGTFAGLGADVLGVLPVVGALGEAARAGKLAMRSVGKVSVAVRSGGRAFLAATGGAAAAEVGPIGKYLGTKGAKFIGASAKQGEVAGKVIQGTVDMATQIPVVVSLAGADGIDTAEDVATAVDFTQGMADNVGDWAEMGAGAAMKAGKVSLARFAAAFA
ncbi:MULTISPECIES: hypothetical protein [unclassified Streptomyces]|uniref:hypothetical protein n=1 Tax=unclassified Streptomyces TaxID=2593676 RepID=UPI00036CEEF4|nr:MULTISPECIES: hypothetical protein [unclassified Streptomyces]MYT27542.1 hypothetical protein [Streptomyces sp. SID8354]